jgi:hypothetical protein
VSTRASVEVEGAIEKDWRKSQPIKPGGVYPAKEFCSQW